MFASTFQRIAIVNRGEPALRLIHAVRELNAEHRIGLETIALYTEPDAGSLFVREADRAFLLGPAVFTSPGEGFAKSTYLDYGRLEQALTETGAEAAWVGWGFVAEHAGFAELCQRLGVVFVGPSAAAMRRLGDKIAAKRLAEQAEVPVLPWSRGPVADLDAARAQADQLGYPVMVKAAAGGGGRGIRRVRDESELTQVFARAQAEAAKAFGDATVFLEKVAGVVRHVEVQVVGDQGGTVWALGVRDCSVQRRNQKLIEEAPCPVMAPNTEEWIRAAAVRLARRAEYTNAGTVEFLLEVETQRFFFMEMNTRLQVEHPVTEMTTGFDLVKAQLHVAAGGRLEGAPPSTRGHAIEVRLNAEDPDADFAPSPGVVRLFRPATGPGVRVDSGVDSGDRIPSDFDSMIAKVIASGRDRAEALARLERAVRETAIVVEGGATTRSFLLKVLSDPDFRTGRGDIGWLDRRLDGLRAAPRPYLDVALLAISVQCYREQTSLAWAEFARPAGGSRSSARQGVGFAVELREGGNAYKLVVCQIADRRYRVHADAQTVEVTLEQSNAFEGWLVDQQRRYRLTWAQKGSEYLVEVDGVLHRISRDDGGAIRSPSPALVVAVAVKPGDVVEVGQQLTVIEAMKTEMTITAPLAGRVREVTARAGSTIAAGATLLVLDPSADRVEAEGRPRVTFVGRTAEPGESSNPKERCCAALEELFRFGLGFDITVEEFEARSAEYKAARLETPPNDEQLLALEENVLESVADVLLLDSRDAVGAEGWTSRECLARFARNLSLGGEGLPEQFLTNLRQTLTHYGVAELGQSESLQRSLLLMHRAAEQWKERLQACMRILELRLEMVEALRGRVGPRFKELLGRAINVGSERLLALHELALLVRFLYYEKPLLDLAQTRAYHRFETLMDAFMREPVGQARERVLEELVASPLPLAGLLSPWVEFKVDKLGSAIVELLFLRFYRSQPIVSRRMVRDGELDLLIAELGGRDQARHAVAVVVRYDALAAGVAAVRRAVAQLSAPGDVLIEIMVSLGGGGDGAGLTETTARLQRLVDAAELPANAVRVCGTFMNAGRQRAVEFVTLSRTGSSFVEVLKYRGLHPMRAGDLEAWRLRNFALERLPSPEDVYVFRGVALSNAKDVRWFGLAEVRGVTSASEANGRELLVAQLENTARHVLTCLRDSLYRSTGRERLFWNRVILYLAPPLRISADEICAAMANLGASTRNLGLEKIVVRAQLNEPGGGTPVEKAVHLYFEGSRIVRMRIADVSEEVIRPLTPYAQRVVRLRARGLTCPYEIIGMIAPGGRVNEVGFPHGEFQEYDLDSEGDLVPVDRPFGNNTANVVVGVIKNFTTKHPEGMTRVVLLGDPSREMGAVAEPECRRIIAGLDLAASRGVPVEWFALSAGAKISMESGTENLDWTARVLRRIIEFTQAGGEINVVVDGVNVGAQSYWNAEATMLMHTRGILVMTPKGAMVLTGKLALDFSGSVSAEDNRGIGGVAQIMGGNGEAQYFARDLAEACNILFRHYDYSYVAPGERGPRRGATRDDPDRDVTTFSYPADYGEDLSSVGEIFSAEQNPQRKRPFAIRPVMAAVVDNDCAPLERWAMLREGENGVVWDATIGGISVTLIGVESRALSRGGGIAPADGPESWTGGTLFPLSSKKVARAINAACGNRPVVVLANLSGFDGSPESMRRLQLEYGAEIGRAVVNFRGPILFCVISRYHGGAYVVFSRTLNEGLRVGALEGSFASVIGGAPAAAVVFASEVDDQVHSEPEIRALQASLATAPDDQRHQILARLGVAVRDQREKKRAEIAKAFDGIHSVLRAQQVGSLHDILPARRLRRYLIETLERSLAE